MTDENVKEILACIIRHIRPDGSFSYFQHKEVEKMKKWLVEFAEKRLDEEITPIK